MVFLADRTPDFLICEDRLVDHLSPRDEDRLDDLIDSG